MTNKSFPLMLYQKQFKQVFPLMGKPERKYVQQFQMLLEDYCQRNPDADIETLYAEFGSPVEVMDNYFSAREITDTATRMQSYVLMKKSIRIAIASLVLCLFTAGIIGSFYLIGHQKVNSHNIYPRNVWEEMTE